MRKLFAALLIACLAIAGWAQKKKRSGSPAASAPAPAEYKVKFETSKGDFVVTVTRTLAPNGADRFHALVKQGFYNDCRFFRVIEGFMVQFGINGDPQTTAKWKGTEFPDDPVKESNRTGTISFATRGPNTRTTQVFINLVDNGRLDSMGFSPFGRVTEGMEIVKSLYSGYGEGQPRGRGPVQPTIESQGNYYLKAEFPRLDYIKKASIVP